MEGIKGSDFWVATTNRRLALAPDIPTLKEQGINVLFQQFRSIAAPKAISAEAIEYYEEIFRKLSESKLWKESTSKKTC
jgi:putative tricarboxylic transport membrane protein